MRDRRQQKRTPVDLFVNKYVDGEPHLCRAVNLNRGGVLLYKMFEPSRPLGEVELEFQLPGDDHVIRATGVTLAEHCWARAHGVRFTILADEDARRIDAFLRGGKSVARATS